MSPRGAVIYSPGQLQIGDSADTDSDRLARLHRQPLDLQSATQENTPPLLWPLVQALQNAHFSAAAAASRLPRQPWTTSTGSRYRRDRDADTAAYSDALGIPNRDGSDRHRTSYSIDPAVAADDYATHNQLDTRSIRPNTPSSRTTRSTTIYFTGQLPVYADIEAVFAQNGVGSGDIYDINSVVSNATAEQLRAARDRLSSRDHEPLSPAADGYGSHEATGESLAAGKNNPYDVAAVNRDVSAQN